jgi:glycosyltransferase involved in cell wall biosynthesis
LYKQQNKISIIIPTYNREKKLRECLNSLIFQDYPKNKMEILVIDNNSKDNTKKIINDFSLKYPFVKYLFEKTESSYICRNKAMKKALGDIICFLDDDCIVNRDWIKKINETHNKNKDLISIFGKMNSCKGIWEKAITAWSFLQIEYNLKKKKTNELFFPTPSITFKRKFISKKWMFKEWKRGADVEFSKRLVSLGNFKYDKNILVYHHHIPQWYVALKRAFFYGESGFKLNTVSKIKGENSFLWFPITLFTKSFRMARIAKEKKIQLFFIFISLQISYAFGYFHSLLTKIFKIRLSKS